MDLYEAAAKLRAISNNIDHWLQEYGSNYQNDVLDLFTRYATVRDFLLSRDSALFSDIPVRELPNPITIFAHAEIQISRNRLELLWKDVQYCLDLLANLPIISIPSMTITREGVFFAGQHYDALQKISEIFARATKSLIIIDGYIDANVLNLLTGKQAVVEVFILTKLNKQNQLKPDLLTHAHAFNKQYGKLQIRTSQVFHDRFIIVDDNDFYHFGASLKDAGHRGFMFSRIEEPVVIDALRNQWSKEWAAAKVEV